MDDRTKIEMVLSLLDPEFYAKEAQLRGLSERDMAEHFCSIGQYNLLSPSSFVLWPWIRKLHGHLEWEFEEWLTRYSHDFHPLLDMSAVPADSKSKVEIGHFLREVTINDAPLIGLAKEWLTDCDSAKPLGSVLAPFSQRSSTDCRLGDLFDSSWYLSAYSDVNQAHINPFVHYVTEGWLEGRDPSPYFSTRRYLEVYTDVHESGLNPLIHYISHGFREGRQAWSTDDIAERVKYEVRRGLAPPAYVPFSVENEQFSELVDYFADAECVIVIPFYKRPDLVRVVLGSLIQISDELNELGAVVLCVNDSPGENDLSEALYALSEDLASCGVRVAEYKNERNLGFIKSSNVGIAIASDLRCRCLLLNSDTIVTQGSLTEMMEIMDLDDKFGFVNPRSNNATICSYGISQGNREDWQTYLGHHMATKATLPRHSVIPTAVGFCLLISADVIDNFGFLDSEYGHGYNEENDYVMRANRVGFVCVMANHSFVAHLGEQSFSQQGQGRSAREETNAAILCRRYSEYPSAVRRYLASPPYLSLKTLEHDQDTYDLLIDLVGHPVHKNGTSKLSRSLIPHMIEMMPDKMIGLLVGNECHSEWQAFSCDHLAIINESESVRGRVGLKMSQPFDCASVERLMTRCNRFGFFMLDTIATDCLYLQDDGLHSLWQWVCANADFLLFNSGYTQEKFCKRFAMGEHTNQLASLHSISVRDYAVPGQKVRSPKRFSRSSDPRRKILIFGNDFAHKALRMCLEWIEVERYQVTVFGSRFDDRSDVVSIRSGELSEESLNALFDDCHCVVFPTFFEGFGFPIMEALAKGKPVVVMDTTLVREIWSRLGKPELIRFYKNLPDLGPQIEETLSLKLSRLGRDAGIEDGWHRSAGEIVGLIMDQLNGPCSYQKTLLRMVSFQHLTC